MVTPRFLALAIVMSLAGCAATRTSVALLPTSEERAAMGKVDVSRDRNANTRVNVAVDHLAPPDRISPTATAYVVWAQPIEGGAPQNLGGLVLDKNLAGKLDTTTPLLDFNLWITAEPGARVEAPTGPTVLSGHVVH
jgi:hypothetical protein